MLTHWDRIETEHSIFAQTHPNSPDDKIPGFLMMYADSFLVVCINIRQQSGC